MLRRDRTVVVAGLAAVTLVAWAYLFSVARSMDAADGMGAMDMAPEMAMPQMQLWSRRAPSALRDVSGHDGCDDGAFRRAPRLDVRAGQSREGR